MVSRGWHIAPNAEVLCSRIGAMVGGDAFERAPRPLADGEELKLGAHTVRFFDAPHVPHGWDCGFLADVTTRTLFCGDLLTQPGANGPALTEGDILGPSEMMRGAMEYYAHAPHTKAVLAKLASLEPQTLACMHGSSYRGNGAALLNALAQKFS